MAGILFLADVLAFVLVLHWTFSHRAPTGDDGETGWFAMRSTGGDTAETAGTRTPPGRSRGRAQNRRAPAWARRRPGR